MSRVVGGDVGSKAFEDAYRQTIRGLAWLAREEGWGKVLFHAVDEPDTPEKIREAYDLYSLIKSGCVETFITATDVESTNGILAPLLDVRTWSLARLQTEADARARLEETVADGDRFWAYGSGSYMEQDGRVLANRFLSGFWFYKSGAGAMWSWTLQRPVGEPFNDFDGEPNSRKDPMMTYPSAYTKSGSYSTLQWEGIREGVDDYRYLHTLEQLINEAQEVDPDLLEAYDALIGDIPWNLPDSGEAWPSAVRQVEELRDQVVALIKRLKE